MSVQNSKSIAFYLRGSRQDEQQTLCMECARLRFGPKGIEPQIFRDDEAPVKSSNPDESARPESLASLREEARAGNLRAVICAELSVLCRNACELPEAARYFAEYGVALIFARERLDTSSATGRTLLYATELLLELERNSTAANIRESMRVLARTGRWLGGVTPTGYILRRTSKKRGLPQASSLELNPSQAKTVRLIYSLFLDCDSISKVTQVLSSQKITTKNGRAFSRFTVRQILENPVYMKSDADAFAYFSSLGAEICSPRELFDGAHGMMVYNKTVQHGGQPMQHREPSEWIVAVGEHEGLIEGESWIAVQNQLARNKPGIARKPKSGFGLMAELLCCGNCGAHMRPKLGRRDAGADRDSFSYLCERKEQTRSGECDMPNLPGNTADAAMESLLGSLSPDEPDLLPPPPELLPVTPEALAAHFERMEEKRALIAKNEEEISALVFSLIKAIDKNAYVEIIKRIDGLHERGGNLRAELNAMEALSAPCSAEAYCRETLKELLEDWRAGHVSMSMARRRAALRALIESIIWDGSELVVRFVGGAEFAVSF